MSFDPSSTQMFGSHFPHRPPHLRRTAPHGSARAPRNFSPSLGEKPPEYQASGGPSSARARQSVCEPKEYAEGMESCAEFLEHVGFHNDT